MKKVFHGLVAFILVFGAVFTPVTPIFHPQVAYAATDIVNDGTLGANVLSCWGLNETSGTRVDESAGSNDLTDNNTVTYSTGKYGNAAHFTRANSEYLSRASASESPDLSINGASGHIFVAAWVKMDSKPAEPMYIQSKYAFSNGNREYALVWDNAVDRFAFRVFNNLASNNYIRANTFGAPSTGTWYYVMGWVDNTVNTVNISVNNGTVDSTALTVTTHNGGAKFLLSGDGNATPIEYWDGDMDELVVMSQVPSSGSRTDLYNSGNGLPCVSTGGGGSPVRRQTEFFFE